MVRVAMAGLLLGIVQLGGCAGKTLEEGDDDVAARGGTSSKPPPNTSPVTQCKSLASTWCNKAFGCYVKVGRIAESQKKANVDSCIKLFVDHAPCSEVKSVGGDYNTCVSQINAMACSLWNVPQEQFGTIGEPVSCESALSFD
jgi:hypothetical protein